MNATFSCVSATVRSTGSRSSCTLRIVSGRSATTGSSSTLASRVSPGATARSGSSSFLDDPVQPGGEPVHRRQRLARLRDGVGEASYGRRQGLHRPRQGAERLALRLQHREQVVDARDPRHGEHTTDPVTRSAAVPRTSPVGKGRQDGPAATRRRAGPPVGAHSGGVS